VTGLEAEGVMDKSHDAAAETTNQARRHRPEGEPVDQEDGALRGRAQETLRLDQIGLARMRVGGRQRDMPNAHALLRQEREEPARVGIAARRRGQVSRHGEGDVNHR
jgi:hypothetical protein